MNDKDTSHRLYTQGRAFMAARKFDEAIAAFQASAKFFPHFKTLELLGECYIKQGKFKKAIIPLAAATTLNFQVRAPSLLSWALMELSERPDARVMAKLALSRSPKNKLAKKIYEETADLEENESEIKRAQQVNQGDGE